MHFIGDVLFNRLKLTHPLFFYNVIIAIKSINNTVFLLYTIARILRYKDLKYHQIGNSHNHINTIEKR